MYYIKTKKSTKDCELIEVLIEYIYIKKLR
uniref:Uncharacterized protein n=1 Tax=Siphoviridae sp. ctHip2 TaxID=2827830 RepID=A0A8S5RVL1_9CAUD|nr:MAG TPA: hypothetical protein [Siphoviridae sp. ctHip2]